MAKENVRRTIIRQWMSLAREKRQTMEQATGFARNAAQHHSLPRSGRPPHTVIMAEATHGEALIVGPARPSA